MFGNVMQTTFPKILKFVFVQNNFFIFSNRFDVLMSKIIFKKNEKTSF